MTLCHGEIAVKWAHQERIAVSLPCRSWGCAECGDKRKRQLCCEICAGNPTTFLTLTLRRSEASNPIEAAQKLSKAFQTLRRRLMYWEKLKELPFLAVFEQHASGWPHLHIFLRMPFIHQKCLSGWMSVIANSPVVDVRAVKNRAQAAGYAAKYTTKDNVRFGTCKRYWQSADYDLRDDYEEAPLADGFGKWEREKTDLDTWSKNYSSFGWAVTWLAAHKVHARAPPG